MGRPAASEANKIFAVDISKLVTRSTEKAQDTIARCGTCSIYALVKLIRPQVLREFEKGPRDGISEVEFNKTLQVQRNLFNVMHWRGIHEEYHIITSDCIHLMPTYEILIIRYIRQQVSRVFATDG